MANTWQSKIVGHGKAAPADLIAHPLNSRLHPLIQQVNLRALISEVGFISPVLISKQSGRIIDGHLRVALANADDIAEVDVTYLDLTPQEEVKALTAMDEIASLATRDKEKLDEALREISTDNPDIAAMFDAMAVKSGIFEGEEQSVDDMWQGMPDFEQESIEAWKKLIVHFKNEQDYKDFAELLSQPMTDKTKSIWYPYLENVNLLDYRIEDES